MATSNFLNVNADNIYAVEMFTDFDHEDVLENLSSQFKEMGYCETDKVIANQNRNYHSVSLGLKQWTTFEYKNTLVEVFIQPIIRAGYYAHANLDYNVVVCVNNQETTYVLGSREYLDGYYDANYFTFEEAEYYDENDNLNLNQDLNKELFDTMVLDIEHYIIDETYEIEKVFKEHSQVLKVVAKFSNGETIYA